MNKQTIRLADFDKTDKATIAAHLSYRLASRVKPYHQTIAQRMIACAPHTGNVAVVANVNKHTVSADYISNGDDSNGDYLVAIVRNGVTCTIMYTRENQVNVNHLRVNQIVYL